MRIDEIAGLLPSKVNKTPGIDCKCCASGYSDCGCGADWTDYTTFNSAIDQISCKEIGFSKKELIEVIWKEMTRYVGSASADGLALVASGAAAWAQDRALMVR